MRLLLIRHGATAFQSAHRYTGQRDLPLTAQGTSQVQALADAMPDWLRAQPVALVTSDLARAVATADLLQRRAATLMPHQADWLRLPPLRDPDLREIAFGAWEGLTYAEAQARDPDLMAAWIADPVTVAPPGGETIATLLQRVLRALDRAGQSAVSSSERADTGSARPAAGEPGSTSAVAGLPTNAGRVERSSAECRVGQFPSESAVIWVTHGGVITTLAAHLLGIPLTARWRLRCDLASVSVLDINSDSAAAPFGILEQWNRVYSPATARDADDASCM